MVAEAKCHQIFLMPKLKKTVRPRRSTSRSGLMPPSRRPAAPEMHRRRLEVLELKAAFEPADLPPEGRENSAKQHAVSFSGEQAPAYRCLQRSRERNCAGDASRSLTRFSSRRSVPARRIRCCSNESSGRDILRSRHATESRGQSSRNGRPWPSGRSLCRSRRARNRG